MSHAYHASPPTYVPTYPTTYHYGHIFSMADCSVHLELVMLQSQPGMTEKVSQRSVHNGLTPPYLSGDSLKENLALTEQVCVSTAVSQRQTNTHSKVKGSLDNASVWVLRCVVVSPLT